MEPSTHGAMACRLAEQRLKPTMLKVFIIVKILRYQESTCVKKESICVVLSSFFLHGLPIPLKQRGTFLPRLFTLFSFDVVIVLAFCN